MFALATLPPNQPRRAGGVSRGCVRIVVWVLVFCGVAGCHKNEAPNESAEPSSSAPWIASGTAPPPRAGMRWIPPGTLVVGTPLDVSPRVADAEMAGEQLVMTGFYVDLYPWPNEAGALPQT